LQAPLAAADHFISSYTLKQIQRLDAGSWFVSEYQAGVAGNSGEKYLNTLTDSERADCISDADLAFYASGKVHIPTLQQVLELVQSTGCVVNIELKTLPRMYEELTEKVVELVVEMGLEQQVILSSFDHQQLLLAKQLDEGIYTAVLTSDRLVKVNEYLELLGAQSYNPGCYGNVDSLGFNSVCGEVDATAIEVCREHGFDVNVWTCNDPEQMLELISLGVTGLMSDIPNRVSVVLG
jgi:glycerophosphoryl diester phosphodiesterase